MLLLDRRSIERVGAAARALTASGEKRVYERDAYRPDKTELRPPVPSVLFNVGRARATELARLDAAAAAATLRRNNLLAKEVRRIAIMAEVLDLVAGTTAPDEESALAELAEERRMPPAVGGRGRRPRARDPRNRGPGGLGGSHSRRGGRARDEEAGHGQRRDRDVRHAHRHARPGIFTGVITARALGPENRGIFSLVALFRPAS
jgi:hypothetical protein